MGLGPFNAILNALVDTVMCSLTSTSCKSLMITDLPFFTKSFFFLKKTVF